jgi:hypothetical protein
MIESTPNVMDTHIDREQRKKLKKRNHNRMFQSTTSFAQTILWYILPSFNHEKYKRYGIIIIIFRIHRT